MRSLYLFGFALLAIVSSNCFAEGCAIPITELQPGVQEADLGNVKIKMELYNKLAKLKLISSLNEDWTSVATDSGVGEIIGYFGNGSDAILVADLIIQQKDESFEWAVFKKDLKDKRTGTAYFSYGGKISCADLSFDKWKQGVEKIIGSPQATSAVNVSNDEL